ncbi:MAG TPA: amidohydrolase family protein [Anaerolineaceae bacterium]|nr:amidohydrolase family protein [Anaerolineaceae bacterium]
MQNLTTILKNAIVLTMNKDYEIFDPGAIAIEGDKIVAVGPENAILSQYQASEVIDCGNKVLLPGLVNVHTHIPMTLLRGLSDDLRLDVWLMGYMMPVEREFVSPEFVELGTKLGCAEFIRSGVTTFNDMYYFEDHVAEATAEVGLRAVVGQTVMKFSAPDADSYEDSLALSENLIQKWQNHALIVPAIAPHAVYTCTPDVLTSVVELAKKYDARVHFHVSETKDEVENLRKAQGMPVVPYIRKFGMLETKLIAAHCVHLDEGEIRTLQHTGVGIAHNPTSNLKLASGFAPVARMMQLGCNVGVGTDGPASNNDLDMFEEIRLANLVAKAFAGDPTVLPARQTLAMATIIGAKALHMDEIIGSLEPGKRADIILVDISPVHNQPRFLRDPEGIYAQLIYAGKSTDVTDTMVNGKWLMKDKELLTIKEEQLLAQASELAVKIDEFLKGREESVYSKLIAIGGAAEEESFEVQVKVKVDSIAPILEALSKPGITILRKRHYHEYDTYFGFDRPSQGRLRYREDEFLDEMGKITSVRSRLTLIGELDTPRDINDSKIMLSRSRYLAPATHSLRFYHEYFKPSSKIEIEKNRLRYLVQFKEIEFFINLDTIQTPNIGKFVEIKSRTWSRQDAEQKTALIHELAAYLGLDLSKINTLDYLQIVENSLEK